MFKKISLRMRITLITMICLTISCIILTLLLNLSANQMVDKIEALPLFPIDSNYSESIPATNITQSATLTLLPRRNFFNESLIYMLVVIVLGSLASYYFTGRAMSKLEVLTSQIKNRNVHNLNEPFEISDYQDEIADLTSAFNEMSAKLDEAFAIQKRFSSSAAHELKTPLTIMKAKVDVFKKKNNRSADEYRQLLATFELQIDRLTNLINDLLSLTNMQNLPFDQRIKLQNLTHDIIVDLNSAIDEKHISVTNNIDDIMIVGNISLFNQLLTNLIENAIKYNVNNGQINLYSKLLKDVTLIYIEDSGIGINADHKALIFEPFYRVEQSRSRHLGGAGLGLSIVKLIAQKHHATIMVEDNALGGTTFILEITNK